MPLLKRGDMHVGRRRNDISAGEGRGGGQDPTWSLKHRHRLHLCQIFCGSSSSSSSSLVWIAGDKHVFNVTQIPRHSSDLEKWPEFQHFKYVWSQFSMPQHCKSQTRINSITFPSLSWPWFGYILKGGHTIIHKTFLESNTDKKSCQ